MDALSRMGTIHLSGRTLTIEDGNTVSGQPATRHTQCHNAIQEGRIVFTGGAPNGEMAQIEGRP
jgi:hypothetical protein